MTSVSFENKFGDIEVARAFFDRVSNEVTMDRKAIYGGLVGEAATAASNHAEFANFVAIGNNVEHFPNRDKLTDEVVESLLIDSIVPHKPIKVVTTPISKRRYKRNVAKINRRNNNREQL